MDDEVVDIGAVVHLSDVKLAKSDDGEQVILPTQASPQDTSNWDDRPFTTPGDRIVIETFQGKDKGQIVAD